MGKLTIVTGPPAGGKSSFVLENAASGDISVDFDKLATALGSQDPHDSPSAIRDHAHIARDAVIDALVKSRPVDSWIIHTTPTSARMSDYEAAGAEFVTVDPGIDVALARAAADGRPEWTEQAIHAWYDKRKEAEAVKTTAIEVQKRFTVTKLDTDPAAGEADDAPGRFVAHVSAFGVLDYQGDIVDKGAYAKSIVKHAAGGKILLYWSHSYGDVKSLIGEVTALEETDDQLRIEAFLDVDDNPVAADVYRHMKLGRLKEFSVGGMVEDWAIEGDDEDSAFHIKQLDLWEVSVCFKGANPKTELLSVKARALKAAPLPLAADEHDNPTPEPARLAKTTQALLGLLSLDN